MNNRKKCNKKRLTLLLLAAAMIGLISGCGKQADQEQETVSEAIKIPMVLTVDPSTGNKNEEKLVEAFNKTYEGIYKVEVEWAMETEEEYRQNLKRLNVADQLPTVMTDLRMLPSFYQMMIQDGRLEDLAPYIAADPQWQEMIEPVVLEGCSEADGSVYLAPLSTAAFSCSGVFWNEELFAQAGITTFPETWEDFWACCEKLQESNITPLALHTEGTAWAPMLFATAELASTREGASFMKETYPASYNNENGIHMAETLQKLFSYTTENALHTDYDVAYDNFFSGRAAMIPNGYWMMDQIPAEWAAKVHFAPFPGNVLISSPETFGWSLKAGCSPEVKEGAIAFLKFRTQLNQEEKQQLFDESAEGKSQAEQDYLVAYEANPQIVPNYQVKWNSILQEETLGDYLPELATGEISPEQFVQYEDESIEEFQREQ
ncbi:MAG: extracellular solute-binding protein [Lachnospiraceae bacterium]|nr:extracellular solute-binding protein [Lachnospiraceae bacterium]